MAIQEKTSERNLKEQSLSIIIPCYNEEAGIPHLKEKLDPILEKLQEKYSLEVIFVNDGSKDRTLELLESTFASRKYCKVISHKTNQNVGQALRTGFQNASGDIIATLDSDCTYDPKEIFEMLKLLDNETDIVTASPYHPKGNVDGVPKYRLFLSKSINFIYQIITKQKIYTFTALFRLQKKKVVKNIHFVSNDFLATAEMLIYALLKGFKVKEFPTTLYVRKYGVSHMRLIAVIKSHAKFVLKLIKYKIFGGELP